MTKIDDHLQRIMVLQMANKVITNSSPNSLSTLAEGTYTKVLLCDDGVSVLKVLKDNKHAPLLKREAEIIAKLKDTELADLFPDLLESTTDFAGYNSCPDRFKCFTGVKNINECSCNLQSTALLYRYDKDMPSLADAIKKYPNGVDERDMVWMFKRLLAAIWTAHSVGVVHSAILPEHILLNLTTHGIWLIDWMHTNKVGTKPKIDKIGPAKFYPEYAITGDNSTALDIHMAARCMIQIMGGDIGTTSKEIRLILRACLSGATDARLVHEQLDSTVKKLFGPSVFRPFKV